MHPLLIALLTFLAIAMSIVPAHAHRLKAFVVGVDVYDNLGPDKQLAKAGNDAKALGATLTELGFAVSAHQNLRRTEFNRAWQSFLARVASDDTVAVFFSGHGVQVGGLNYLLPRDVPKVGSGDEGLLRDESIALQKLLDDLKAKSPRLTLVIIDACRDNPFALPGSRSVGGARGLARIDQPPEGTFVMLSAGAGETALDRLPGNDPSPTSVYTRNLLPLLTRPNITLQQVAVEVRDNVRRLASSVGHKQTPAYWDELIGPRVCLAGSDCGADTGPAQVPPGQPTLPPAPPKAPVTRPPVQSGPLTRTETGGLTFTVERAAYQQGRVTLAMQVSNGRGARISLAADGSIRPPDNRYITYVASLVTSGGATCYAQSFQGLDELDLSTARNFGGPGFNKDRVDRAMTVLGAGSTQALTLVFADCRVSSGDTGHLTFTLHTLDPTATPQLGKISPAFAAFPLGQ